MRGLRKWIPFRRRKGEVQVSKGAAGAAPAHPLAQLHRELDRLFERVFGEEFPSFGLGRRDPFESFFGDFAPAGFTPSVDVTDRGRDLEVVVELPGLDEEDVKVELLEDALVVRGEKRMEEVSDDDGWYRAERAFGAFERVVPLPVEVDAERAEARFEKGVLRVRLPKAREEAAPKRIPIRKS